MNIFRISFFIVLLSGVSHQLLAQKLVPFKDPETRLMGVEDTGAHKIIIPALYSEIVDINGDSLIVVRNPDSKMGILNTMNQIRVKFAESYIGIYNYDPLYNGRIYESPEFTPFKLPSSQVYFIDRSRKCVSSDYYPCPWWKPLTQEEPVADYRKNIQKAKQLVASNHFDSAVTIISRAIRTQPNNAAVYFDRANLLFYNDSTDDFRDKDEIMAIDPNEPERIIYYLNLADSLEKRPFFNLIIKNRKYDYYTRLSNNRHKLKALEDTLKQRHVLIEQSGFYLISSVSHVNGFEAEIGLGFGYLNNQNRLGNPFRPNGLINYGLTWSRNFSKNYDAFRLYLYSVYRTVSFGVSPILYYSSDYLQNDILLRPEIGYGFDWFSLQAGYNLHVAGSKFSTDNCFTLSLKVLIPLSTWKNFSLQSASK